MVEAIKRFSFFLSFFTIVLALWYWLIYFIYNLSAAFAYAWWIACLLFIQMWVLLMEWFCCGPHTGQNGDSLVAVKAGLSRCKKLLTNQCSLAAGTNSRANESFLVIYIILLCKLPGASGGVAVTAWMPSRVAGGGGVDAAVASLVVVVAASMPQSRRSSRSRR